MHSVCKGPYDVRMGIAAWLTANQPVWRYLLNPFPIEYSWGEIGDFMWERFWSQGIGQE